MRIPRVLQQEAGNKVGVGEQVVGVVEREDGPARKATSRRKRGKGMEGDDINMNARNNGRADVGEL